MYNSTLPKKLYNLKGFQEKYLAILLKSVLQQFNELEVSNNSYIKEEIDWNYMLLCGSILARSNNAKHLDYSYRIAQYCLNSSETNESEKKAALVILDSMTNIATINLAIQKGFVSKEYQEDIPLPLRMEMIQRGVKYSIFEPSKNQLIHINKFQLDVLDGIRSSDKLSISAPTSAGKSFILLEIISDILKKEKGQILIYLVPTRSLIQQVEFDLFDLIGKHSLNSVYITTVPILPKEIKGSSMVYVLTQERFQWLLTDEPDLKPNLVVVDEAQKIGDGSRGILLQQVIEEVERRSRATKIIFSSPMTSNPEILLDQTNKDIKTKTITTEQVTVNQNLLWVSQVKRKPKLWEMNLCVEGNTISLGKVKLIERPSTDGKRLPFVAYALADKSGGNLLYANKPADAESIASLLWELQGEISDTNDADLLHLIDLVKKVINHKYVLGKTLNRGIGFHYGNMPLLVKNEIERLFSLGKIKFLICTSTLIEGMNLPAKSIFVRGPRKGLGKPMGEIDFWNLAGRAGRQGKEFQGNVICVDPDKEDVWKGQPPLVKKKYKMERTVDNVIEDTGTLIDFINKGTPRHEAISKQELEHGFVYLVGEHLRNGELRNSPLLKKFDTEVIIEIEEVIEHTMGNIDIPEEIIFRNPGISPIAQQNLLDFFRSTEDDIELLIPPLPESEDAFDRYYNIIEIISEYLSGDHLGLTYPHTLLILEWMNGHSLSRIINRNWKYWRKHNKALSSVIRNTMKDIEEYARFKFLKYSSCYSDVLKYFLATQEMEELIEEIPELNIWLEFGASQGTQVSLMSIGLTRTTAISISELIVSNNLTPKECVSWLIKQDLESLAISPILIHEILRIVNFYKNETNS